MGGQFHLRKVERDPPFANLRANKVGWGLGSSHLALDDTPLARLRLLRFLSTNPMKTNMKLVLLYVVTVIGLLSLTACGDSPEAARKKLASMGMDYSVDQFVFAANKGDMVAVKAFIDAGMAIDTPIQIEDSTETALSAACSGGQLETVKYLLAHGANVNAIKDGGVTPLMWAVQKDQKDIVEALLAKQPDLEATINGRTALDMARLNLNMDLWKRLNKAGAKIMTDNYIGELLGKCRESVIKDTSDIVDRFRENEKGDDAGVQAMHKPFDNGQIADWQKNYPDRMVCLFLLETYNGLYESLLRTSRMRANLAIQSAVIPDLKKNSGVDAAFNDLQDAAKECWGIYWSHLQATAATDKSVVALCGGKGFYSPLMCAAREGDVEAVKWLIANGADVNRFVGGGRKGVTAMSLAKGSKHDDVASLLQAAGANCPIEP